MRKPDINSGWCDRLRTLYEIKGYKVDERGELLRAVKDMYECGALIYTGNEDMNKVYQNSKRIAYNHITRNRTPDMDWLRAYQIFFSCSFDYLFGLIKRPTHELETVGDITGLSDDAIKKLIKMNRMNDFNSLSDMVSLFLEEDTAEYLLSLVGDLIRHSEHIESLKDLPHDNYKWLTRSDISIDLDGRNVLTHKDNLLESLAQTEFLRLLENVVNNYRPRYGSLEERREDYNSCQQKISEAFQSGASDEELKNLKRMHGLV